MAQPQPQFRLVRLYETNGSILCRHYDAIGATAAVLWLGGFGGGFDSPARDLFGRLATRLMARGISSLRMRYRMASDLDSSVEDALVALEFLGQRGISRVATIGHAFGGAVSIQAGAASPMVTGVAAIATQSYGTSGANRISPRPLLLVHGTADTTLPSDCSQLVFERALEPKELFLVSGADHCFDQNAVELQDIVAAWLATNLPASQESGAGCTS